MFALDKEDLPVTEEHMYNLHSSVQSCCVQWVHGYLGNRHLAHLSTVQLVLSLQCIIHYIFDTVVSS